MGISIMIVVFGRPTITDARGRKVPLTRFELPAKWLCEGERRDRLRRAGYPEVMSKCGSRRTPELYVSMSILVFAPMLVAMLAIMAFELPILLFLVITPWLAVGILLSQVFCARRLATRSIAEAYIRAHYCASCGHDLTGSETSGSWIATCGECGAAWRMPPEAGTVCVGAPPGEGQR